VTDPPNPSVKTLIAHLHDSIRSSLGGTSPIAFGGGHAASLFSKALKAGESEEALRKTIDLWIAEGPRSRTVAAFAGRFDELRSRANGRNVSAVAPRFPKSAGLVDRATDDERRRTGAGYLGSKP
jgi:hypothetical protein